MRQAKNCVYYGCWLLESYFFLSFSLSMYVCVCCFFFFLYFENVNTVAWALSKHKYCIKVKMMAPPHSIESRRFSFWQKRSRESMAVAPLDFYRSLKIWSDGGGEFGLAKAHSKAFTNSLHRRAFRLIPIFPFVISHKTHIF